MTPICARIWRTRRSDWCIGAVSFLGDIDAHTRLLVALPLLVVAEPFVHQRLTAVVRQFFDRALVAPASLRRFVAAVVSSVKLRNSAILEVVVLLVAVVGGQWVWESRGSVLTKS
jgi:hypothetical protein